MSLVEIVTVKRRSEKLGYCVLCGDRVYKNEDYVKAKEGITHRDCISLESDQK